MKPKRLHELRPNDELWQPDPFREPRAWALAWGVTELLERGEVPAIAGPGLNPATDLYLVRKEADARSAHSL